MKCAAPIKTTEAVIGAPLGGAELLTMQVTARPVRAARRGRDKVALVLVIVHTLIMVAGLSLLGQGLVGIFNWRRRQDNFVYQLFSIITRPIVSAVRVITPRLILDEHVPLVAFFLLLFGYFGIGLWHRDVCLGDLNQTGCAKWAAARAGATQ
jgi:uncharacterized protein YggT (Ycf19 family)